MRLSVDLEDWPARVVVYIGYCRAVSNGNNKSINNCS